MILSLVEPLNSPHQTHLPVSLKDEPQHQVFVHLDVIQALEDSATDPVVAKRIRFNLQWLLAKGYAPKSKGVTGDLKGWRRALLGGNGGSHFYLWYVPSSIDIGRELGLPDGAVAVRQKRHHDDFSALSIGSLKDDYVKLSTRDIEISNPELTPYTSQQVDIAGNVSASVTMLRGYPGSGKTTSLLLSALQGNTEKVLYLTYSEKLANEASQFFATFRPEGAGIEVMTYQELLDYLEDSDPTSFRPSSDLARDLLARLGKKPNLLRFLADQPDELYAELHAHALGRALPIPFGGLPASIGEFVSDYRNLRQDEVGPQMVQVVSQVVDYMQENDLVAEHFPMLVRARRNLTDVYEPPPPRLVGCSAILVDEVQDLTQIEALLLLNVCARIGLDTGNMPRIVIAGDESQTVRPTDFRWSWLKNLVTAVFGSEVSIRDESLDVNLRSPREIARFVEATRNQYVRFEKSDRPAGMTYTETNDAFVGRVMYCVASDDKEMQRILEVFRDIPRSCLIYPGYTVPEDLAGSQLGAELVVSAEDVKGLDFDVVGLVDAGVRQEDLESLLKRRLDEPYVDVFGRTLADQYRVAASRAAETLVLVDRGGRDLTQKIREFCGTSREEIALELVEIDDLEVMLYDGHDQEDFIRAFVDEVRDILDSQTERAILRSASLVRQFERLKHIGGVDPSLEHDVLRLRGVALLSGLLHDGETKHIDLDEMAVECKNVMQRIDLGEDYEVVLNLATARGEWWSDRWLDVIGHAVDGLSGVQRSLPEVYRKHEGRVLRWHDRLLQNEVPFDPSRRTRVLEVATKISDSLGGIHPHLVSQLDAIHSHWAAQLVGKNDHEAALGLLRSRSVRDPLGEAQCLKALNRFEDAAMAFVDAGDTEEAIECFRMVPNLEQALSLAQLAGSESLEILRWLEKAESLLGPERDAIEGSLTSAEATKLRRLVASRDKVASVGNVHPDRTRPRESRDATRRTGRGDRGPRRT
jgi:hypothetical protein